MIFSTIQTDDAKYSEREEIWYLSDYDVADTVKAHIPDTLYESPEKG